MQQSGDKRGRMDRPLFETDERTVHVMEMCTISNTRTAETLKMRARKIQKEYRVRTSNLKLK